MLCILQFNQKKSNLSGSGEAFSAQIIFGSNTDVIIIINDHLRTIHHEQPMDSSVISNQECEANALCQASFSTVIISALSAVIPSDSFSYAISLIAKPISFIPEQPQRPPLT